MRQFVAQILLHLSEDIARRFKQAVPARQRSRFVEQLIQEALPSEDDDPLYRIALEVQQDEALNAEMAEWERTGVSDGLEQLPPWRAPEQTYTPRDLAARLGLNEKNVRDRLRQHGYRAGQGKRYSFEKAEYERLAELLAKGR
jgi:hypothetical protein